MEQNNHLYGLIGYPLSHSFSLRYFTEKFNTEGLTNYTYKNFPIQDIRELPDVIAKNPDLCGFNVTIPYKEQIIPYIDVMDHISQKVGAVNTVQIVRGESGLFLKAYNTDVYGFNRSLEEWLSARNSPLPTQVLILGTGGASKAVAFAMSRISITTHLVSRHAGPGIYKTYSQLDATDMATHPLIINTTPLGMHPKQDTYPDIPYQYLNNTHFLYDLIYNPEETLFMKKGKDMGAAVHNGERMLQLQADKAWRIWTASGS